MGNMAQGRYLSWHPYGVHPLRAKRSGDPRMVSDDVCDENELFREVSPRQSSRFGILRASVGDR